jgi:hypothetical protein
MEGCRYIAELLSLNRDITMALVQEDNISKAVEKIKREKGRILRA